MRNTADGYEVGRWSDGMRRHVSNQRRWQWLLDHPGCRCIGILVRSVSDCLIHRHENGIGTASARDRRMASARHRHSPRTPPPEHSRTPPVDNTGFPEDPPLNGSRPIRAPGSRAIMNASMDLALTGFLLDSRVCRSVEGFCGGFLLLGAIPW